MLRIRLQRLGKKKSPTYRVIISEQSRDPHARALEILGSYNPVGDKSLQLKEDRVKHWLAVGAQPSETVANLLINAGLIEDTQKKKSVKISNKRQVKLDKKREEEELKKKAAKEAVSEVPAEEVAA
ncbi:30S ribosomal protein S16 [Patescibacteria group bacterium]|nr:30S ribosomal protein S16 [Patescibacteria group bacterium]MBU1721904.1 30S ribosomal protein S16 [Patescibacteria group bacterium]MBU1900864.1 30S ribosomal protein S16 [Patescibacteria group bacterium]